MFIHRYGLYQRQGGGLLFLILMILFFGAIAWLIISAIQHRQPHHHGDWSSQSHPHAPAAQGRDDEPMRILDRRFASGEIDEEEYQRRRKVLSGNP